MKNYFKEKRLISILIILLFLGFIVAVISLFFHYHQLDVVQQNNFALKNMYLFDSKEREQLGHTGVLREESNKITYSNKDQSTTTYFTSYIEDSTSILKTTDDCYPYRSQREDIISYFPDTMNREFKIVNSSDNNEVQISLGKDYTASYTKSTDFLGDTRKCLQYRSKKNSYTVYPTNFGFNIDKSVESIDEAKERFEVKITDCYFDNSCAEYVLMVENNTQNVKAIVYAPVYRANDTFIQGRISVVQSTDNTFVFQTSFSIENANLCSGLISQSIYLYRSKQPDSVVYEGDKDMNSYLSQYMFFNEEDKKEGLAYIRFEDLNKSIDPETVISAKYYVRSVLSKAQPKLFLYPVIDDWCSFTTNWTTKARYDTSNRITPRILMGNTYEFDITEILKDWLKSNDDESLYSIRKGVVITSSPEYYDVLCTNDHGLYGTVLMLNLRKENKPLI